MNLRTLMSCLVLASAIGCGGTTKKGAPIKSNTTNNGAVNNGAANNGETNNGTNNGALNNGLANNGAANNGSLNNGTTSNNTNNGDWSECYYDEDGDGFGGESTMIDSLCAEAGLADAGGDCDDARDDIYPGASETACDGIDYNCDGSRDLAVPSVCGTIQEALDAAAVRGLEGVITVAAGTYNENLVFNGAPVHLLGAGPALTTIDGVGGDTTVVRFDSGEDERSILEGFTITGGAGYQKGDRRLGGGIYVSGADPVLRNLSIVANEVTGDGGYGGGLSLENSDALVERVVIQTNGSSYYGGGLYIGQGAPTLRNLHVFSNGSTYGGGAAIYFSQAEIEASIFALNTASYGGAAFVQGEAPLLQNLTVLSNEASEGGGVFCSSCDATIWNVDFTRNTADDGGAVFTEDGDPNLGFTNFYDNSTEVVGLSLAAAPGIVRANPTYMTQAGGPLNWDLHLMSSSALINAGDSSIQDADGSRSDIGAYGGAYGDW